MTPQEQEMIDGLISRIRNTQVQNKDVAAEQRLQQGLAGSPDALYVLAQTVLVQQYGLQQAQAQLSAMKDQNAQLQQQLEQAGSQGSSGGGFLSHIFGSGSHPAPPQSQSQPPQYQPVNNSGYGSPGYGVPGSAAQAYPPPPPAYPPQGYSAPASGGFGSSFGGGGFLSGALQTAAGVAAGEAMFQGMESLFHGFDRGGSGLMGGGGGGETINNYYDDDRGGGDREDRDRGDSGRDDNSFYNPSDDASRDTGAQFADTADDNSGSFDDSSNNFDDNSSFDDNTDSGGGGF